MIVNYCFKIVAFVYSYVLYDFYYFAFHVPFLHVVKGFVCLDDPE